MAMTSWLDPLFRVILYGVMILSLYMVDLSLGSGLALASAKLLCSCKCALCRLPFLSHMPALNALPEDIASSGGNSVSILLSELIIFAAVFMLLGNVQKNHIGLMEQLLKQSQDKLEKANSMLDKWNRRKNTAQIGNAMYEKNEEIALLRPEMPIVHMSLIDASPSQLECAPESKDGHRPIPARPAPSRHIGFCPITLDDNDVMSIVMRQDDVTPISEQDGEELDRILSPSYGSRYLYDVAEEEDVL